MRNTLKHLNISSLSALFSDEASVDRLCFYHTVCYNFNKNFTVVNYANYPEEDTRVIWSPLGRCKSVQVFVIYSLQTSISFAIFK